MDLLDQQLLLAQYNEARRNTRHQRQVDGHMHNYCSTDEQTDSRDTHNVRTFSLLASDGSDFSSIQTAQALHLYKVLTSISCVCVKPGLLQWTRLFPSLRHRGQNRPPMEPRPQAQTPPSTQSPLLDNSLVAEEQVGVTL